MSGFLNNVLGRYKAFWVKSHALWINPIQIIYGGGSSPLSIVLDYMYPKAALDNIKYVWTEGSNGEKAILKVTSILDNSINYTIITESTTFEPEKIYQAIIVRLTSDKIDEVFMAQEISQYKLSVKELVAAYE